MRVSIDIDDSLLKRAGAQCIENNAELAGGELEALIVRGASRRLTPTRGTPPRLRGIRTAVVHQK